MTTPKDERRFRELLAEELERRGLYFDASTLRSEEALTEHGVAVIAAMSRAADRDGVMLDFQTCAEPEVKTGNLKTFVVLVRRASGGTQVLPAYYLNAYPLEFDECVCTDNEGHDDGCPTTGWYYDESNLDYQHCYFELEGAVVAWAKFPDSDAVEASLKSHPASPAPAVDARVAALNEAIRFVENFGFQPTRSEAEQIVDGLKMLRDGTTATGSTPTPDAAIAPSQERDDIFAVNVDDDGVIRIVDLCFTAFMHAKNGKNGDDGGPCDWFNDTYPAVVEKIAEWRSQYQKQDLAAYKRLEGLLGRARSALEPFAALAENYTVKESHCLGFYLKLRWEKATWGEHDITPASISYAVNALAALDRESGS